MEWLGAEPGVSWGFSFAQRPSPPYSGQVTSCWSRSLSVESKPALFPLRVSLPQRIGVLEHEELVQALGESEQRLCPPQMLLWVWALPSADAGLALFWSFAAEQVRPVWMLRVSQGTGFGSLATVSDPDCFWIVACVSTSNGCPTLLRCHFGSGPPLCLTAKFSPWLSSLHLSVELHHGASGARVVTWLRLGCTPGWSRKLSSNTCSFNSPPPRCFGSEQVCKCSSWVESRLPTSLLLVLLALQPA